MEERGGTLLSGGVAAPPREACDPLCDPECDVHGERSGSRSTPRASSMTTLFAGAKTRNVQRLQVFFLREALPPQTCRACPCQQAKASTKIWTAFTSHRVVATLRGPQKRCAYCPTGCSRRGALGLSGGRCRTDRVPALTRSRLRTASSNQPPKCTVYACDRPAQEAPGAAKGRHGFASKRAHALGACTVCLVSGEVLDDDGMSVRWCQLCKNTHPATEFLRKRKSCDAVLLKHNSQRVVARAARQGAVSKPKLNSQMVSVTAPCPNRPLEDHPNCMAEFLCDDSVILPDFTDECSDMLDGLYGDL